MEEINQLKDTAQQKVYSTIEALKKLYDFYGIKEIGECVNKMECVREQLLIEVREEN